MKISVNELKNIIGTLPSIEEAQLDELHMPIQYLNNDGVAHPTRTVTLVFKKNLELDGWNLLIPHLPHYPEV